jgi:excisionase family DNA binding protein
MFTVKELALKLKISERTVLREIKRGKIKVSMAGKRYLVTQEHLDFYLNHNHSSVAENINQFCESRKHEMITLLQKLVSIPAESNTAGEEHLARYLKKELDRLGIRSFIHGEKDAVVLRGSFGYADRGLLLDCPLDTTPAGDSSKWTFPPFEGVIKGGRMYGRGVADAKAGMVAMIYALLALDELVDKNKVRVEIVFDGGEQNGGYLGMKSILKEGLPVDAGIVGYAGSWLELTVGARGYHRYTFTSHGQSVHTGSKSKSGVNAISNMAKFIVEMEKQIFPTAKDRFFSFGSRMTFAQIEGGRAINIVPDLCISRLDVRTTKDLKKKQVDKRIEGVLSKLHSENPGLDIDYRYELGQEAYLLGKEEKIQTVLLDSIKESTKVTPAISVSGPAHIGNLLAEHGIPVVLWGPKGGNVHSYDEYVEIESIYKTANTYALTILKYFDLL